MEYFQISGCEAVGVVGGEFSDFGMRKGRNGGWIISDFGLQSVGVVGRVSSDFELRQGGMVERVFSDFGLRGVGKWAESCQIFRWERVGVVGAVSLYLEATGHDTPPTSQVAEQYVQA